MDSQKDNGIFRRDGINYLVPFILITTLFFLWGFARAILDVLNKHFQNELSISITQSAWIQVTTYLGYFLMAIPAGLFINRYGYRRGVVFGLLLFALGALAFVPAESGGFYAFVACLFVIGCGLTFLETAANPYSTELGSPETASSRLNLSQSFNGMGSLFATFAVGQFLFNKVGNVTTPYLILGVLVLGIAVVFSKVKLPEISETLEKTDLSENNSGLSNLRELFAHHPMLTVALAFFMVGRFGGSWIMRRISGERMLLICAFGTVCCMILVLLNLGKLSMVALIANYLFEAIMFPTIFSLALSGLGHLTKSASSLLMMTPVGGCGFLLMGYVADQTNLIVPFFIPLIGYLLILFYALRLQKRP